MTNLGNVLETSVSSFDIRISSLLQSRYAKPASDLRHFGLRERFALFNSLLDAAQDNLLQKFNVVRIDNFSVDLDRDDIARAVRRNLHFPATGAHFDGFLLELGMRFR